MSDKIILAPTPKDLELTYNWHVDVDIEIKACGVCGGDVHTSESRLLYDFAFERSKHCVNVFYTILYVMATLKRIG